MQQQERQLPDVVGRSSGSSEIGVGMPPTLKRQSSDEETKEYEEPYVSYVRAPSMWQECQRVLLPGQWDDIMGGTAEKLYGHFEV